MRSVGRPRNTGPGGTALGVVLSRQRNEAGLTRTELARKAGLSTNTLMKVEQGRTRDPGFSIVAAVCRSLSLNLEQVAGVVLNAPLEGKPMTNGIVSAGYEGATIDEFIEGLRRQGVTTLFDVRLNPISRKPGFSKTKLAEALEAAGIAYRHLRSLGNQKDNREPFRTGRVDEGRAVYRSALRTEEASEALAEIATAGASQVIAITCFEADEELCHRHVVIEELSRSHALPTRSI